MRDLKIRQEFKNFIKTYGVLSIAIGIVMGNAVAKIINVIVEGLVMPFFELILPGAQWQDTVLSLGKVNFKIGLIIAAFLNFFSVALVVFFMVKYVLKLDKLDELKE